MNPNIWIAHILAFHLVVPEPIHFTIGETYPYQYKAMIAYMGEPGNPQQWWITYNEKDWNKHNDRQRMFVIAHEVCHAAYDYDVNWNSLDDKSRARRHKTVHACADRIMRDHYNEHSVNAKNRK